MSPALTFFAGLGLLILFGWYFATDLGLRKRLLATVLMVLLVAFSIATIYPPQKKIQLGLDIQGGTSFLIRLMGGDKEVNKAMLEQVAWSPSEKPQVFVCGPTALVEAVAQALVELGHDPARIKTERFGPTGPLA